LDSTKKASLETENKVKQLKNEVMIARKELDDLKRREHSIEKERHTIIAQKKRTAEQSEALKKQVAHSKAEMEKQTEALDIELTQLNNKIVEIKSINVGAIVQKALDEQDKQRKVDLKELDVLKSRMESNNQRFIAQVREHIQCLMDEARHSASEDWKGKVTDCNDDVNGLVARIKAGANVYL
jgi:chromosome segregation ATPase